MKNYNSIVEKSYETINELNFYIDLAKNYSKDREIYNELRNIQEKLLTIFDSQENLVRVSVDEEDIQYLENIKHKYISKVENANEFVVPGISKSSSILHIAKTICTRAERDILSLNKKQKINPALIKYIQKLSDVIYTLAKYSEDEIIYIEI
ncbi:cob(I)alamin adenosyltransferase [Alkalithermobacter thermoalcaliphilus JW-YL-7 = DSM 7308]|uniref:Corrinoid adenosyltransferase n=1 Tax=Alkalithermobacter thermoalcaliphilus JW-YL-7 = DSM 7308 TaxID=1121328 RepID=A0A150FPI4_CLOPD|nr:cobalamin adenosyltransferase [[Clostridium] paradoxum JW-YL-7 = DSM 7308]SHL25650.1 cob(I)alamin adenosyltransferase [[Clostridium] paradoxum JW-YL-7 = DSM 7308]